MTVTLVPDEDVRAVDVAPMEERVIDLRMKGVGQQEIADDVGLDRATVRAIIRRTEERVVREYTVESIRASDLQRIERLIQRIWPLLDPDDPDASPDVDAVMAFIALSKRRSALVGANVLPSRTLKIDAPAGMMPGRSARESVDELERMMELADRLVAAG